jgi:hypothetical protein
MVYDAARHRVVLFGGTDTYALYNETWEWGGTDWMQRTPGHRPPGTIYGALAFDAARQRVVLWGGDIGDGGVEVSSSETWVWDGIDWIQRTPLHSPSPRNHHALAYDSARERVVLFGGADDSGNVLGDTWEWDGALWTEVTTSTAPVPRSGHAMAYDSVRYRIVLFGGADSAGNYFSDTWEWDGASWTERAQAGPSPRGAAQMAYFGSLQRPVIFGGGQTATVNGTATFSYYNDTWQWDGTAWTQIVSSSSPSPRGLAAMTYDSDRAVVVLFGGAETDSTGATLNIYSDTWTLSQ